jgi:FtsZ-interacting cell division protein ZipA
MGPGSRREPGRTEGMEKMSTLAIVLIVIGALIVIGIVAAMLTGARQRRLEDRRQIARQHREEADSRRLDAEMNQAAADEKAARARREAAEAESRSQDAEREQETARAHAEHAQRVDPDA